MSSSGQDVYLYIYDLSQGMAQVFSQMLLGKQIDGVWHTAIVVFGREYFYGSGGVQYCHPCGTVLGEPKEKHYMGKTEVPQDLMEEYLRELGDDTYQGNKYDLFHHNCNNFSNDLSQFLTGKQIPSYITDLPAEVMATPFGAQLKPIIQAAQENVTHADGGSFSHQQLPGAASTAAPASAGVSNSLTHYSVDNQQNNDEAAMCDAEKSALHSFDSASAEAFKRLDSVAIGDKDDANIQMLVMQSLLRYCADETHCNKNLFNPTTAQQFTSVMHRLQVKLEHMHATYSQQNIEEQNFIIQLSLLAAKIACNTAAALTTVAPNAYETLQSFGLAAVDVSVQQIAKCSELGSAAAALLHALSAAICTDEDKNFSLGCLLIDRLSNLAADEKLHTIRLSLAKAICQLSQRNSQLIQLAAVSNLDLTCIAKQNESVRHLQNSIADFRRQQV